VKKRLVELNWHRYIWMDITVSKESSKGYEKNKDGEEKGKKKKKGR
jgi:hypothetical protein